MKLSHHSNKRSIQRTVNQEWKLLPYLPLSQHLTRRFHHVTHSNVWAGWMNSPKNGLLGLLSISAIFFDFLHFCRFVKTKHNNALGAMTIWPPSKLTIGNPSSWETQPVFRDDLNFADITTKRTCPMEAQSKIGNDAQVLSVISLTMIVSFVMTGSMLSVASSKSQLDTPSGHSAILLTAKSNQSDNKNALLSGWVCFKHCTRKTS